jgi:hypothetical protein
MISTPRRKKVANAATGEVSPQLLELAERRYRSELRRLESDKETFACVDDVKDDLRHYFTGVKSNLSDEAKRELAAHALFNNVTPDDEKVRQAAELTLGYWRTAFLLDIQMTGPRTSNKDLIRRPNGGNGPLGWLDITERQSGHPSTLPALGKRIPSVALQAAIEALGPCWTGKMCGSKSNDTPSRAARFFHRAIIKFEPDVTVENINSALCRMSKRQGLFEPCPLFGNLGGECFPITNA